MSPVRPRKAPSRHVGSLLMDKRILVCVGAGGVGKTTLAASMALRTAREGRSVTCLTIDPARRLADSLGVDGEHSGGELRDITHIIPGGVQEGGSLSFGMLDPVETFNGFVRKRSSSHDKAERILGNKLYRYISGSLSGMQEYMALEKLCEISSDDSLDLIVLDTPPTANALDFFTAPSRMMEALDGPLVRVMRRAYGGPGRVGFDLMGRGASVILKGISRLTGTELLGEMMGFIDALSDLFGSFSQRAKAVEGVLHGDDVAFCLITTPDKSTYRESAEFRKKLDSLGLSVSAVLFNRSHWPRVPAPPDGAPAAVAGLNDAWNLAFEREQEMVSKVREAWHELDAVCSVPLMPYGVTHVESLDALAKYL